MHGAVFAAGSRSLAAISGDITLLWGPGHLPGASGTWVQVPAPPHATCEPVQVTTCTTGRTAVSVQAVRCSGVLVTDPPCWQCTGFAQKIRARACAGAREPCGCGAGAESQECLAPAFVGIRYLCPAKLCHCLPVWTRANHFTPLYLSLPICIMGRAMLTSFTKVRQDVLANKVYGATERLCAADDFAHSHGLAPSFPCQVPATGWILLKSFRQDA